MPSRHHRECSDESRFPLKDDGAIDWKAVYEKAYKRPKYRMLEWRQDALRDYLEARPIAYPNVGWPTMLDVGCGRGETVQIALDLGVRWTGCDIVGVGVPESIDVIDSATDLPYADSEFDLAICMDVMEHIPIDDVDQVLREIMRVSKRQFFGISCKDDIDGFHITVRSPHWWLLRLAEVKGPDCIVRTVALDIPDKKQPLVFLEAL